MGRGDSRSAGPETFAAAKLAWAWPEGSPQAQLRQLYQDLLAARRRWPALRDRRHTAARLLNDPGAEIGQDSPLLVLQRGGDERRAGRGQSHGRAQPMPETQVAGRTLLLSTEDAYYGGSRPPPLSLWERGRG